MLIPYSVPRPMGRPMSAPESMSSASASASSSSTAGNIEALKLGKQPLPRELDWELYKQQVLDKFISEAQLGENEEDLVTGPYSQSKAKYNDVLQELLAIQFTITKLEARPGTASTNSSINVLGALSASASSVASAEASSSKRHTQDTVLTVPPETLEAGLAAKLRHDETSSTESKEEEIGSARLAPEANGPEEEGKPVEKADEKSEENVEENVEESTEEIQRPASRASTSSSDSDASYQDPDRPWVDGPIHDYFPPVRRYLSRRDKIKRALWSVRLAPGKASASVRKSVFGEEPWSTSPYFLYDEYRDVNARGFIEKFKFELQQPDRSTVAGKMYARAREPYFKAPGSTKRECVSCTDMFPVTEIVTLDCDHRYCEECLNVMVMTASQQESTMPPKCCSVRVRPNVIKRVLKTDEDKVKFSRKIIEYDTVVEKRLFCPKQKCGAFIPYHPRKDQHHPLVGTCQKCGTRACRICKGKAHKHTEDCPEDLGLNAVIGLSKDNGWKRCYRCRAMIELNYGCNHMTCRCGAEFCYMCGNPWSFEYGCPTGCTQTDDDDIQNLVNEINEAEQARLEAETAIANDPEAQERLRQEQEAKQLAEEQILRTEEDLRLKALFRTQKEEQETFNTYSGTVLFKLRQRHYEEMTDLQLAHVGEFLTHNSELEDQTLELSQQAKVEEAEFCQKLGMTLEQVKASDEHEGKFVALCRGHRESMLRMKGKWDIEHTALKFRHSKALDKLRAGQRLEERVVELELLERKTGFITEQRNVLARMIEWRKMATGLDYAPVESVYKTIVFSDEDAKLLEDELLSMELP
ncbi:hypothetical protein TWF106_005280 [Orbilia oligospora]|uniref:RBR-type E3 ubiquitin transferase n=1 Tax=Orbilia oligospora TaxID=2813651 RepID=A0A6G1MLY9_ORBOL|nr:hypothetical protein TWF788_000387 [Orbilia oligospora]KAF3199503.1 hypothetical protein TWF679_001345 [Orbilia oligospora]KAF3203260.1 hypothetical protein TWF191_002682 [Orbilia oligospora]KAF3222847.1 hypothetical protein TWF106_005280 [Orbilia oligospora]KAF3263608.1 hypothetical protein TWF192_005885 [Orbilia oligospora]